MSAESEGSYSVAVHGRCIIAHSFKGECFGAAQQALHGCTYIIDAIVEGPKLETGANSLVDICFAEHALHDALGCYHERNLDELDEFAGENTTCERVARAVWERMAAALPGPPALTMLRIVVHESDVVHVEYERALGDDAAPALYTVSVRGRFMAARSLRGVRFSESQQRLNGGTFVVDALFSGTTLENGPNYLIDVCLAEELVRKATAPLQQTHLDGDSTVLLKAAGVANATASGLAKALWTSIAQGLPPTHGLRGLKLVVAEHDASVAEYDGRLDHAPTPPMPMCSVLERRLMEQEPPGYESGWPLISADDLPCMHVLTAAPRPHRYVSGGRHTIVQQLLAVQMPELKAAAGSARAAARAAGPATASAQASERTIFARARSAMMLQALARGRSTRKLVATKKGQAELQERAAKHHKPSPPPSPAPKSPRLPTGPMKADGTSLDLSIDAEDDDDDDDVGAVAIDARVSAVTIEAQTPADSTLGMRGARLPGFLKKLKSAVRERYGERYGATVLAAAETVWKQALETADKAKLAHFLRRAEISAQAQGLVACPEETVEAIFSFVLKLMLYAGADWYEVATGLPPPESVALRSPRWSGSGSNLGVAFDASSRLRRAGIEAYHTGLAAGHAWSCAPGMAMLVAGQGEPQLMPIASLPPKAADRVRVVAISDTHLLHGKLVLPEGDLLVHAGDMCYEESRSLDAERVEAFLTSGGTATTILSELPTLDILESLRWIQGQVRERGFEHAVIVGGNHDFTLDRLGAPESTALCDAFGLEYLHDGQQPVSLHFESAGRDLTVWGSGASLGNTVLDKERAIKSGNTAFQTDDATFARSSSHVCKADIIVVHGPPREMLMGKKGKALEAVNALLSRVQPELFICGHAHNGRDLTKDRVAALPDGRGIGINACVSSTYNSIYGYPIVVDL